MKICVLLSTYNGEKFLSEQLESIVAQQGCEVDVLVRDDGSSDNTSHILDEWQNQGKLKWYKGPNLGYAMSFLELVKTAGDYDYYAFCDQDDIWLPDKLKTAIDTLEESNLPIKLYCSNVQYYKDGIVCGSIHESPPYFDKYTCLLRNIAPGCSMVFDKELKNLLSECTQKKIIAHDFWTFQVAVLLGHVYYDFHSNMLYRQHENNQIGHKTAFVDRIRRRLNNICSSNRNEREEQAKELLACFADKMSEETKTIVISVAEYRRSLRDKIKLLLNHKFKMDSRKGTLYLKLRILFSLL